MKKKAFISAVLSLTMTLTSMTSGMFTVYSAETTDTEITETEYDEEKLYGDITQPLLPDPVYVLSGNEVDLKDVELCLTTYEGVSIDKYNSDPFKYNCHFTVGSGLYSDLYTIDTSKVNTNKPGKYEAYIKPKKDAVGTFKTENNWVSWGNPPEDGEYEVQMIGKESKIEVIVLDAETEINKPFYIKSYTEFIEIPADAGYGICIECAGSSVFDVEYEIEDPSIVKVIKNYTGYDVTILAFYGLKEGTTTITAKTADGRTATEKIKVTPPEITTTTKPVFTTTTTGTGTSSLTTTSTTTTEPRSTVSKWWYQYDTTTSTTTTTVVYSQTTTSVVSSTTTTTTEIPVSTTYCYAPTIECAKTPMKVGETREVKVYNPMTNKAEGLSVSIDGGNMQYKYEEGSDKVTLKATKEGTAKISFTMNGCAFIGHLDIEVLPADTTTTTTVVPTSTTSTTPTTTLPTTSVIACFQPTVEYDKTPMKVGETREIRVYNPETKTAKNVSTYISTDNMEYTYEEGTDKVTLKALKAGTAKITFSADGCAFNAYVNIDIITDEIVKGDANNDGVLNMADAVLIMQSLANPDRYKLSAQGRLNGDIEGNNDGITNLDALAIQKILLKLD